MLCFLFVHICTCFLKAWENGLNVAITLEKVGAMSAVLGLSLNQQDTTKMNTFPLKVFSNQLTSM